MHSTNTVTPKMTIAEQMGKQLDNVQTCVTNESNGRGDRMMWGNDVLPHGDEPKHRAFVLSTNKHVSSHKTCAKNVELPAPPTRCGWFC